MIVDTSALVAVAFEELGAEALLRTIITNPALIPAPVIVEYERVVTDRGATANPGAAALLAQIFAQGAQIATFTDDDARFAAQANTIHGKGNGRGGTLNLLDLMVFGMAQRLGLPILCTGRDFKAAGARLHPASRLSR